MSHLETLSSIEEDDPGVGEDRFAEIQDDIQYLRRLQDLVNPEIEGVEIPGTPSPKLRVVPKDGSWKEIK